MNQQPVFANCPVNLQSFLNQTEALENFLRKRATVHHQRSLVGQLGALRRALSCYPEMPPKQPRRVSGTLWQYLRRYILARDGNRCTQCGESTPELLEVHHKQPVSEGGTNEPDNLETLCHPCHVKHHAAG